MTVNSPWIWRFLKSTPWFSCFHCCGHYGISCSHGLWPSWCIGPCEQGRSWHEKVFFLALAVYQTICCVRSWLSKHTFPYCTAPCIGDRQEIFTVIRSVVPRLAARKTRLWPMASFSGLYIAIWLVLSWVGQLTVTMKMMKMMTIIGLRVALIIIMHMHIVHIFVCKVKRLFVCWIAFYAWNVFWSCSLEVYSMMVAPWISAVRIVFFISNRIE